MTNTEKRMGEERNRWLAKHRNADLLVFDEHTRNPVKAVYYSLDYHFLPEVQEARTRFFFQQVREAAYEDDYEF